MTTGRSGRGQRKLVESAASVTDRDRRVLAWLGRHRFATAGQVARAFSMHQRAVYQRLRQLGGLGLVAYQRWWYRQPGVYVATRDGLSVGEVALPVARVDVRTYWHTLAEVDLAIELADREVVSEREIRALDQGVQDPRELTYCAALGRGPDGVQLHVPDLMVCDGNDGRPHAFEVELTAKRLRRLRQILRAYMRARHLSGVTYVTPSPQIARAVERVAAELKADDVVTVQTWQPTEGWQ